MIKYIVEYGFINREGACISYECDSEFDILEKAQLYVDSYSFLLHDDKYLTIWYYDDENEDYEFIFTTLRGDKYE